MSDGWFRHVFATVILDQLRQPTACVSVTLALHHAAVRRKFIIATHNQRRVK